MTEQIEEPSRARRLTQDLPPRTNREARDRSVLSMRVTSNWLWARAVSFWSFRRNGSVLTHKQLIGVFMLSGFNPVNGGELTTKGQQLKGFPLCSTSEAH
jgi:hypothetical protein